LLDIGWLASCLELDNNQTKKLLRKYLSIDPTSADFREILYFKNLTNFVVTTLLIGAQEEKNQDALDYLLQTTVKKSFDPDNEDITTLEILSKKGLVFTKYALSWLKEFIENQYYNWIVYDN